MKTPSPVWEITGTRKLSVEEVALAFQVPYWLVDGSSKPSWLRRPVWRFRALRWRRHLVDEL